MKEIVKPASTPTLLFPILLFLLFGASAVGEALPNGTSVGKYVMASFGAFGGGDGA